MPSETILVVEDEDFVREILADILGQAGYAVVTAAHGAEALERLEKERVDLVLSDISMPVMDGYALYERVRARPEWISMPFVFLTALGQQVRVRYGKELGVDDYLVKPVSTEDLVVAVRALLDRRARLEQARAAQIARVKETILNTLSHELRSPLTVIQGYAEMLSESAPTAGTPELRELVGGIRQGAERLRRLADDLFTLVELRSGEASRTFEAVRRPLTDLPSLLRDAVAARASEATSRRLVLRADVPERLPAVLGDARLLGESLDRLLDNAIKFSKREGGRVTLRAREEEGRVLIEVRDEGVGIPAGELERISELFYQVDRATNEQQGSGSGLTIARAIAILHGGTLEVESEPGVGSTFTLALPADRGPVK